MSNYTLRKVSASSKSRLMAVVQDYCDRHPELSDGQKQLLTFGTRLKIKGLLFNALTYVTVKQDYQAHCPLLTLLDLLEEKIIDLITQGYSPLAAIAKVNLMLAQGEFYV